MPSRKQRLALVAVAAFSALFAPAHSIAREQTLPEVDLGRITLHQEYASAPAGPLQAKLTLDVALQKQAERQLQRARPVQGALVVLDVDTGKVLVWAERKPPQQQSLHFKASAPAASVFKLVTSVALLERGQIRPKHRVCISGGEHGIYRRHLLQAKGPEASCAPFSQALGHSRNAVYAQLASQHLRPGDLLEVAERIGFNRPLPFDVNAELGTLAVPDNDLEFARTAAGFSETRLTPLGAAYLAFLVANAGRSAQLTIVDSVGAYRAPERRLDLGQVLSANTAWRLVRMMEVTVHGGTSLSAFSDEHGRSYLNSIRVAGKTGTLQLTPDSPTTSWFTGFAPSRNPRVVVAVLLQNGRVWHRRANQIGRDMLRQYFADRGAPGVTAP